MAAFGMCREVGTDLYIIQKGVVQVVLEGPERFNMENMHGAIVLREARVYY